MQFNLWHQFRGIELDMIVFLFENVIHLYFSWWSLWKYVQKYPTESTDIAWNEFLMIQQEQWIGWLKSKKQGNGRGWPSWISKIRLVKIQNYFRNGLCVKHLIGKVVLHPFLGPFSCEVHFQYDHWPQSWIQMFGLVKILEMIPGNKHILLKMSFLCEIQLVIWVIWLKTEKMELVDGCHLEFWYLDSSKYKNDARNGLSTTFSRKGDITLVSMTIYF